MHLGQSQLIDTWNSNLLVNKADISINQFNVCKQQLVFHNNKDIICNSFFVGFSVYELCMWSQI